MKLSKSTTGDLRPSSTTRYATPMYCKINFNHNTVKKQRLSAKESLLSKIVCATESKKKKEMKMEEISTNLK